MEKRNKLLIAEDEEQLRRVIIYWLEEELSSSHIEFLQAGNSPEALKIIQEQRENLFMVITDINMPPFPDGNRVALAAINEGIDVIVFTSAVQDVQNEVREKSLTVLDKATSGLMNVIVKLAKQSIEKVKAA